jgi:hypothetical protein
MFRLRNGLDNLGQAILFVQGFDNSVGSDCLKKRTAQAGGRLNAW